MKNDTTLSLHFLNLKPDQQDALRQLPQTLLDTLKSNNITPPSCIQLTQETSDGYTAHLFVKEETLQELESDLKILDESQVHKKIRTELRHMLHRHLPRRQSGRHPSLHRQRPGFQPAVDRSNPCQHIRR